MSRTLLRATLTILAATTIVAGEAVPAVPKAIAEQVSKAVEACDKAKAACDAAIAKQREGLLARLRAESAKAVSGGDLAVVNALNTAISAIEGGAPETWNDAIAPAPAVVAAAANAADDQIRIGNVAYNPGLVARVFRNRRAGGAEDSNKSPFVFLLRAGDNWDAVDKILLDRTRGKYTDWDPRFSASGVVVMERDGAIAIDCLNAVITIGTGVVTEAGNWGEKQHFAYKLAKGVYPVTIAHMNWDTKRFALSITCAETGKPVLYHLPKTLAGEVGSPIKLGKETLASELVIAP